MTNFATRAATWQIW